MGDDICNLVISVSEDAQIASFDARKAALREQVRDAGAPAITIFAADKLSDIRGLHRGIERSPVAAEERMATTIDGMADHYAQSVAMITESQPASPFVPDLLAELDELMHLAAQPLPLPGSSRPRLGFRQ